MTDTTLLNNNLSPQSQSSENSTLSSSDTTAMTAAKKAKVKRIVISTLSVLLILFTLIGTLGFFLVYAPARKLMAQAETVKAEGLQLKEAVTQKDLVKIKAEITDLKRELLQLENTYSKVKYASFIPVVNNYYKDGGQALNIAKEGLEAGEIVIQAIEPYQDFLGLKGESTSGEQTTEDRIAFLTESIEGLVPHFDTLEGKLANIEKSLDSIDALRYPEQFRGYQVRSTLLKAKELVAESHKFIKDGKPILTKTSWLLGKDAPRNYLMIFQNDGELRPSGGFWTAYGTLTVKDGKISPGTSGNIYDLDDALDSTQPAHRLVKSYHINVPYQYLRDSNLSPDFPTDAQIFLEKYQQATGNKTKIDAVIALDTFVLVDLVKVLGKIDSVVGTFTADPDKRCDGCPNIIYELEWMAGRPRDYIEKDRKGFLGPLMHSLLANAMGSEKSKMPLLASAFFENINEKHIMLYFPDTTMQEAAQKANMTGHIVQATDANVDYIHLNDANFSSAKTNLFLEQKIKHEITSKNGKVAHKISVTYTNPSPASNCNLEKGDLCLNAPKYRNLFRWYLDPKTDPGSIKITGSEIDQKVYPELGKTVVEGFFGNKYPLYAKSSSKTSLAYTSGVPASKDYTLLLQKQPGTKPVAYELWVNGKKHTVFDWTADKTIKLAL